MILLLALDHCCAFRLLVDFPAVADHRQNGPPCSAGTIWTFPTYVGSPSMEVEGIESEIYDVIAYSAKT